MICEVFQHIFCIFYPLYIFWSCYFWTIFNRILLNILTIATFQIIKCFPVFLHVQCNLHLCFRCDTTYWRNWTSDDNSSNEDLKVWHYTAGAQKYFQIIYWDMKIWVAGNVNGVWNFWTKWLVSFQPPPGITNDHSLIMKISVISTISNIWSTDYQNSHTYQNSPNLPYEF